MLAVLNSTRSEESDTNPIDLAWVAAAGAICFSFQKHIRLLSVNAIIYATTSDNDTQTTTSRWVRQSVLKINA